MMMFFTRFFSILALLMLAACGGGGGGAGSSPLSPGSGGGSGSSGGTTTAAGSLKVSISSTDVTSAVPATVTATVLDSSGSPLANTLVTLTTTRGNLATLAPSSVLTNAQGTATARLSSAGSGAEGADEVIAAVTAGTSTTLTARVGFSVKAESPTISMTPSSGNLKFSTAPLVVTARVLSATGAAVPNQLVSFATANGLATLDARTALTNASGDATVSVRPLSASTAGAEIITASATVAGRDVLSRSSIQITAETPSLTVAALSSTVVTSTAPVNLRVVVRDPSGNLLKDAVVNFGSTAGLLSFTPATQSSDSNGEASTIISPRTAATNGADTLVASVTVQGVTATAQRVVQVSTTIPTGTPTLDLSISSLSISAASPATVIATLRDAQGKGVGGQVITFSVARGLAVTNIATALTQSDAANLGKAIVLLSPASASSAGADDVSASVTYAGTALQSSKGFQVQATPVTLDSLVAAASPLSAYGQTTLTLNLSGASVTSPVNIAVSSSCVSQGKATLSPATFTATTNSITMQYRDNGCGAVQSTDQLQAVVTSTGVTRSLTLPIQAPADSSIAFRSASPEQIFLRGSGFAETSVITFEVRDSAGNPLPNRVVELRLQTGAGGVTMEGRGVESVNPPSANPFTLTSNALGQVAVRVNSGTLPTPIRVNARLQASPLIATVSSNLSVAVGLPSQLNFSMSQGTRNIEGYNIDGTPNTYQIIAADRSGNPVPAGTSINFVTEGGQIEAIRQTQLVAGIARTTAAFVSSEPRPVDGRVTITAYALGEESFIDLNGNNAYDLGEPFQDLGNVFKDRNYDGVFASQLDEFIPLTINNKSSCVTPASDLLLLDASIPSAPSSCDSVWSGAGQVYVRRAVETVLSTSAARPLWGSTRGLDNSCQKINMQIGPNTSQTGTFTVASGGETWYGGTSDTLNFITADANPGNAAINLLPRLNPMAAGTRISASTPTSGLTVTVGGGSPVPSSTEATASSVAYAFTPPQNAGVIFVTFTSPSGFGTTVSVNVVSGLTRPTACP